MQLAINISEDDAKRLETEASKLGLEPADLAKAAVLDLLERNEDFARAASYVLEKNDELYERLS